MSERFGWGTGPPAAQLFGNAGREHMERFGSTEHDLALIAAKNHSCVAPSR